MTPLDVIKTRLQIQQKNMLSSKCYLYCNGLMDHICPCNGVTTSAAKNPVYFNGTLDAFVKISRIEGFPSLWSGLAPTLVLALPSTIIYFVGYEQLRTRLKDKYMTYNPHSTSQPFWIPLMAGCSSRIITVSVVNPLELIRTKVQSEKLSYREVGKALRALYAFEGITGFWKGWVPTLYRDVPFSGIYWTSYETIKRWFNVTNPSFAFSFFGGAAAGSIAAFATTPFDVVKTHKQIEYSEKMVYGDKTRKSNPDTLKAIQNIYRKNGIKGMFSGLTPRLAKVAPACAIMIGTFEYGKSYFYEYNIKREFNF